MSQSKCMYVCFQVPFASFHVKILSGWPLRWGKAIIINILKNFRSESLLFEMLFDKKNSKPLNMEDTVNVQSRTKYMRQTLVFVWA